jgi:uncharacterized membrane protein YfcA
MRRPVRRLLLRNVNHPDTQSRIGPAILIACLAALLSTMLGIGGGVVMVPLLTLFARTPIKRAAGTSLAVIFPVIAVGLVVQLIKAPGDIHWPAALLLAAGGLSGAFIGRWLNERLPERVFRYAFCAVLLVVAVRLIGVLPQSDPFLRGELQAANPLDIAYLAGVGVFAGIVAALFGLGGGVVAVPALALAYGYFQQNFTAARATSLAMILPTSLLSAWLHWRRGNVEVRLVKRMAPFAVVFAVLGVLIAYAVPAQTLKVTFGVVLIAASMRLALQKKS